LPLAVVLALVPVLVRALVLELVPVLGHRQPQWFRLKEE